MESITWDYCSTTLSQISPMADNSLFIIQHRDLTLSYLPGQLFMRTAGFSAFSVRGDAFLPRADHDIPYATEEDGVIMKRHEIG